jgi:hypothetical protein
MKAATNMKLLTKLGKKVTCSRAVIENRARFSVTHKCGKSEARFLVLDSENHDSSLTSTKENQHIFSFTRQANLKM